MYGPLCAKRYDSFVLSTSSLLNKLQEIMTIDAPEDIEAVISLLYGDLANAKKPNIFADREILLMTWLMLIGNVKYQRFMGLLSIQAQYSP